MILDPDGVLAYRGSDNASKYSKTNFIWGVDPSDLGTDEQKAERAKLLQNALETRYKSDESPYIRKVESDKVEFEHGGKHLGARYKIDKGEIDLGAGYEVELLPTLKRPK